MIIRKVLIANRGEIALRVIRACKEMGITTILAYSEADTDSLPVKFADESFCIGPAPSNHSYLNHSSIIATATLLGANAIHPGYGFLSENATFASICEDYGIQFIGPSPSMLKITKNKANVRQIASKIGVPILPGTLEPIEDEQEAKQVADQIGYPVLLKAAMGGGGRGIRLVQNQDEMAELFSIAKRESFSSFGSEEIYIEKCLIKPRHIEVQILGDGKGQVIHLGVRECSIQRKHQKIMEEAPTKALNTEQITAITNSAVTLASALQYENAGTCEFLADESGHFYFLEINARIQVEHPITEETTGIDIVKAQFAIAQNKTLPMPQEAVHQSGWAMEFRINAEDPVTYTPSAGKINFVHFPLGRNVRIDSHLYSGYSIPPYYDSLIAKLIVKGATREECIQTSIRCLDEFTIDGIKTNISLLHKIVSHPDFEKAKLHTGFIEEMEV